ncbi:MAG: hypothetical protein IT536_11840 [Hyphomicrobiales bacterium]|nr:hypothetical protein [Hyphomicrobiales bacterium]
MVATDSASQTSIDVDRDGDYVPSNAALAILGVKPQTLYSYVSRGLIRRLAHPNARTSYYNRHDIQRLKARSLARSGHGPAAASAMHWGEPILETAITEITPQGPRYRAHLAVDLARDGYAFEAVAGYLWSGRLGTKHATWPRARKSAPTPAVAGATHVRHVLTWSLVMLDQAADRHRRHRRNEMAAACDIIRTMAGAFGWLGPQQAHVPLKPSEGIAQGLARSLGIRDRGASVAALNAALVLLADHELTPPTFAARISASVGSELEACIVAALQVHFGSVLALCSDRLEELVDSVLQKSRSAASLGSALTDMRATPGFEHPLYARGDPRAKMLLDLALSLDDGRRAAAAAARDALASVLPDIRQRPHLSEALVVLCRALGLRRQAAGGLLALGRAAGWIAHVLEQRRQGSIIRPRGKFAGAGEAP